MRSSRLVARLRSDTFDEQISYEKMQDFLLPNVSIEFNVIGRLFSYAEKRPALRAYPL